MLTKDNYKDYVGYQTSTASPAMAFMMQFESTGGPVTDDDICSSISDDKLMERFLAEEMPSQSTLNIVKHVVECTLTLDEMIKQLNAHFLTFPKTSRGEMYARNKIAFNTRRGIGNKQIDNVILYKGAREMDACLIVVQVGDLYGIALQNKFSKYGFILDDGSKV